jgi:hypothetical protein
MFERNFSLKSYTNSMCGGVFTAKFEKKFAAVGGLNNNISININIKYPLCGLS